MEPGADLMLLHPNGKEEVLRARQGARVDRGPYVSFDGQWVYYAKFHDVKIHKGSDIYKIHVPTRKTVQLTRQLFTPNTGAADWTKTPLPSWGVHNSGRAGARRQLAFVSDRNASRRPTQAMPRTPWRWQLFIMDEDGGNVECIGHLNLGMACTRSSSRTAASCSARWSHRACAAITCGASGRFTPTARTGGRCSARSRSATARPTRPTSRRRSPTAHRLRVVLQLNNAGFGSLYKFPPAPPEGYPAFGPGHMQDPRNAALRHGRHEDGRGIYVRFRLARTASRR